MKIEADKQTIRNLVFYILIIVNLPFIILGFLFYFWSDGFRYGRYKAFLTDKKFCDKFSGEVKDKEI